MFANTIKTEATDGGLRFLLSNDLTESQSIRHVQRRSDTVPLHSEQRT